MGQIASSQALEQGWPQPRPCWGFRLLLLWAIQRSILEFVGHSIWNMCWGTPLDWVVLCVSCFGCQQCLRDSDASSAFEIIHTPQRANDVSSTALVSCCRA